MSKGVRVCLAAGQAWDTAQRTAGQVRRQSSQGLSSAQSVLADNPLVGIMVGTAVGVMVGYLIGHMTASTRTTGTRRYDDRDEFGDAGGYPAGYGGSYSSSSRYPDGARGRTSIAMPTAFVIPTGIELMPGRRRGTGCRESISSWSSRADR